MDGNHDEPERVEIIMKPMESTRQDEIMEIGDEIEDHEKETTWVKNSDKDEKSIRYDEWKMWIKMMKVQD